MGFLSTREQASLIVLAGLLAWILTRRDVRGRVPELLKQLLSPTLLLPFLAMFAHMSLEVWIGFQLGFWHAGLTTATIIWAVASGGVLLFKSAGEAHENPFFFHATAAATIAPTVFVTFTVGLLPFLFAINLYAAYGRAFRIVGSQTTMFRARQRARIAIALTLHFRAHDVAQLRHYWMRRIVDAKTLGAARSVVREFERSLRHREHAIVEEVRGLVRYAGVDGTDSEGRRLDRREFRETIKALRWLATCHMGHYRSRKRYDPELLTLLGDSFHTRHGLPRGPGIKMKVAEDGQRWFAYRRTISGWCFAIGAAGPPPGQWEYDGENPPSGFPREDPSWGDTPFREAVSRNWNWD